jgi:SAM-dependent methyltransferase
VVVLLKPSDWITRWAHLLTPGCTVLDVACGGGRHLAWLAQRGHGVTGIDQSIDAARQAAPEAELVCADIENGPWPLLSPDGELRSFGAVVVTNYLWRPLLPTLLKSLEPGGVLLYETFADGNAQYGRPSRPDFLLQPGELLRACAALDVVAYEHGFLDIPPRVVQRIAALRPVSCTAAAALWERRAL